MSCIGLLNNNSFLQVLGDGNKKMPSLFYKVSEILILKLDKDNMRKL